MLYFFLFGFGVGALVDFFLGPLIAHASDFDCSEHYRIESNGKVWRVAKHTCTASNPYDGCTHYGWPDCGAGWKASFESAKKLYVGLCKEKRESMGILFSCIFFFSGVIRIVRRAFHCFGSRRDLISLTRLSVSISRPRVLTLLPAELLCPAQQLRRQQGQDPRACRWPGRSGRRTRRREWRTR